MQALDVISLEGRWYALEGDRLEELPAFPSLDGPLRVLADFNGALLGSERLDARPAYAAALIERRLRDDGLVGGQAHMILHRNRRVGGGCQVIFTAVETDSWQRYCTWLEKRSDVTELIAVGGVMASLLNRHSAVVVQSGAKLHWLSNGVDGPEVFRVAAYSDASEDVAAAVASLVERIEQSAKELEGNVLWCDLLCEPVAGDAARQAFSQQSGLRTEQAPSREFSDSEGRARRSAAPWLLAESGILQIANPPAERLAAIAQRAMPFAAAATLVLAVGMAAMGWYWQSQYQQIAERPAELRSDIERLESQTRAIGSRADRLPANRQTLAFLERMVDVAGQPDLVEWVQMVSQAAEGRVAIYRLQLSERSPGLRVEGISEPGAGGVDHLSSFIAALRFGGYAVTPAEASGGALPAGYFAFHISRVSS